jgi:sodium/bile acid cotransporter 7
LEINHLCSRSQLCCYAYHWFTLFYKGYGVGKLLMLGNFNSMLASGIIVSMCCPTTVSSNVVLTVTSKGNEAASVTNSVIGNVVGVFVSPLLILWLLDLSASSNVDYTRIFGNLAIVVIGPLILGQIIQYFFPEAVQTLQKKVNLSIFNSTCLLILIYSVFCDTFANGAFASVDVLSVLAILAICLVLYLGISVLAFCLSRVSLFSFTKADSISILFCSSQKTVALGIPLINVIFQQSPSIAVISIPLLIYHAEQLFIGALFVPWLQKWISEPEVVTESNQVIIELE